VPNHKTEIENGVENSTPFFCTDDLTEKGFFYSVRVRLTAGFGHTVGMDGLGSQQSTPGNA